MSVERGNGPSEERDPAGHAHAEIRLAGPERARRRRALHEMARARRLDELAAERRIEEAERALHDRDVLRIHPETERGLRFLQAEVEPLRRIAVQLNLRRGVL